MIRHKLKPLDVLLFLGLCVVTVGMAAYFFRTKTPVTIRVKVTDRDILLARNNPSPWFADRFQIGDVEYDGSGREISKIISLDKLDITENQTLPQTIVYATITTNATYDSRTKSYTLKNQKLVFGTPVRFIFSKIQFDGIVTDVQEIPDFYQTKTVTVDAQLRDISRTFSDSYGVPNFMADAIKAGDDIKDGNGEVIVHVVKVTKVPAARTVLFNGRMINATDPNLFDVTYTLDIKTKLIGNRPYYFDSIPIQIGSILYLNFPQINAKPTITKIYSQ